MNSTAPFLLSTACCLIYGNASVHRWMEYREADRGGVYLYGCPWNVRIRNLVSDALSGVYEPGDQEEVEITEDLGILRITSGAFKTNKETWSLILEDTAEAKAIEYLWI